MYKRQVQSTVPGAPTGDRLTPHLSTEWAIDRLAVTDGLLLCMACHELWDEAAIPPKVTISEYLKLANLYGTAESARFLHGVLGSVAQSCPKSEWVPPVPSEAAPELSEMIQESEPETVPDPEPGSEEPKSRWILKTDG